MSTYVHIYTYICKHIHMNTGNSICQYRLQSIHSQHIKMARVLQCVAVRCSALQCAAVRCSALQCAAVRCSELQWIAAYCSALQCVAVRCGALQCVAYTYIGINLCILLSCHTARSAFALFIYLSHYIQSFPHEAHLALWAVFHITYSSFGIIQGSFLIMYTSLGTFHNMYVSFIQGTFPIMYVSFSLQGSFRMSRTLSAICRALFT